MRAALWIVVGAGLAAAPPPAAAEAGWVSVDRVVAVVNRDVILASEVERRSATFKGALAGIKDPAERAKQRTELGHRLLDALVDETLFAQAATRAGVTVSEEEVARAIEQVKRQNKIDAAGLAKALAENGYTMGLYVEELRRQILQVKAIGVVIRPRIVITEQELRAAYDLAKKADPKTGAFEEEKERLRGALFEQRVPEEARKWAVEARAASHIEVRR